MGKITNVLIIIILIFGGVILNPLASDARSRGYDDLSAVYHFGLDKTSVKEDDSLDSLVLLVDSLSRSNRLQKITIYGSASPDGRASHNLALSKRRAEALAHTLTSRVAAAGGMVELVPRGEDWELMMDIIPGRLSSGECAQIQHIVNTVPDPDRRELMLRRLNGGDTWATLLADVFPALRRVVVDLLLSENVTLEFTFPDVEEPLSGKKEAAADFKPAPVAVAEDTAQVDSVSTPAPTPAPSLQAVSVPGEARNAYLRTNLAAWLMLVANISAEIDFAEHFSAMLPVYYSGWNFFKSDIKYRTFTVLPEVRWWVSPANRGLFLNVHGGFSYYNYALGGDFRYQDHDGNTPAWGGGVGVGYRLSPRGDSPWQFEFSVGAGVYRLDYDIFRNEPGGQLTGRRSRTFFGVDNAAVTLTYRLGLPRRQKGGGR